MANLWDEVAPTFQQFVATMVTSRQKDPHLSGLVTHRHQTIANRHQGVLAQRIPYWAVRSVAYKRSPRNDG